jgi:murein DD-endopeptidase MepM/ murein hydrolase activator NlpD
MAKNVGFKKIKSQRKTKFILFTLLLFLILILNLYPDYPEIFVLNQRDVLFRQLQTDIKSYYEAKNKNQVQMAPVLTIYQYRLKDTDDIFALAARLNIPYDTIATLNHISNPEELHDKKIILIANLPGIFVPKVVQSDLEDIMLSWRMQKYENAFKIFIWINGNREEYLFFADDRFHSIERAYFLKILFRFPLDKVNLTSQFGVRIDPFTGHPSFHNGIDLGTPVGSPVYAAKDGTVIEIGYSNVYGNYIIIEHPGNFQTVYGHLSQILVKLSTVIQSGTIIAKTGMSGRCTGPHLHFEIRRRGSPENPVPLLPIKE